MALMHKMMGNNQEAMDLYIKALQIYEDTLNRDDDADTSSAVKGGSKIRKGKYHASYASTLTNLGLLYKSMATSGNDGNTSGNGTDGSEMDAPVKLKRSEIDQLLERSEEALTDALHIHTALLNPGIECSANGKLDADLSHSKDVVTAAMALGK